MAAAANTPFTALRSRFVAARNWLGRFPLWILQLGLRVGVGLVFFNAGILKYQSFEFAVKLFQDEYKVPLLPPEVTARITDGTAGLVASALRSILRSRFVATGVFPV